MEVGIVKKLCFWFTTTFLLSWYSGSIISKTKPFIVTEVQRAPVACEECIIDVSDLSTTDVVVQYVAVELCRSMCVFILIFTLSISILLVCIFKKLEYMHICRLIRYNASEKARTVTNNVEVVEKRGIILEKVNLSKNDSRVVK